MDTTPKYILQCEKAGEIQKIMHEVDNNYRSIADWRFQGYCVEHKCLLTEGYEGDVECPRWRKIREAPHKGGWNQAENQRRYDKDDCRRSSDKFWIALPHQDQLQEIYGSISKGYGLTWVFAEWLRENNTTRYIAEQKFNSQEQLWLIFVMWEKYNKVWNGKEWVHEKN